MTTTETTTRLIAELNATFDRILALDTSIKCHHLTSGQPFDQEIRRLPPRTPDRLAGGRQPDSRGGGRRGQSARG